MNIANIWRRPARIMPLAVISVGVVVSYAGAALVVWLLLLGL
jgi:hypothetical protein